MPTTFENIKLFEIAALQKGLEIKALGYLVID